MKLYIGMAIVWFVLALLRIPLVESWSFLPNGSLDHWWGQLGIRLFIAGLFVQLALSKRGKSQNG